MKVDRLAIYMLLFFVAVLMVSGCARNQDIAGATTETTNGIVGSVVNADATSSPNTVVKLFTEEYDPVSDGPLESTCIDTTDSNGTFRFKRVKPGRYSILARNRDSLTSLLMTMVDVAEDSVTTTPPSVLQRSGSFSVNAVLEMPLDSVNYVYIPGTDIFATVESDGTVILRDIPVGSVLDIVCAAIDGNRYHLLRNAVTIVPDTLKSEPMTSSRRIFLNTTVTGADVHEDLYGFPVLIRLHAGNFDFSEALPDGSDLKFTNSGDRVLPHELERFDTSDRLAEIWVKVDTLFGNCSDQWIRMHWGTPNVSQIPENQAVFDTAHGFRGVWHLGDTSEVVYESTQNRFHGISYGNLRRSECMIGNGLTFDSSEAYCEIGNVSDFQSSSFTVSAWIRTVHTGIQTIIAKSNGGDPYPGYGWIFAIDGSNALHCFVADAGDYWGEPGTFHFWSDVQSVADFTKWYYAVAVVNRSDTSYCKTYIDGIDVTDNTIGDISGVSSIANDLALRIGTESDGHFQFFGSIDEVVISHVIRSPSWIRVCYSNQGPDDCLVVFE